MERNKDTSGYGEVVGKALAQALFDTKSDELNSDTLAFGLNALVSFTKTIANLLSVNVDKSQENGIRDYLAKLTSSGVKESHDDHSLATTYQDAIDQISMALSS